MEEAKKPTYLDFDCAFTDKLKAITKVRELKKAVETLEITLMFSNDFTNIDTEIKEIEKQVSFLKDDDFYALCNGFTWGYLSFKTEYENISHEEINKLKSEVSVLKEQIEAEGEVLDFEPNESDQIALISAVNALSNMALIENGYFDGTEFTKDEMEDMTHLDKDDRICLIKHKFEATKMIKELLGDVNDGKYIEFALAKLETVIFKPNEILISKDED